MLILGIDTSDKNINIALSEDEKIIASIAETNQVTENLILFVDKLFKQAEKRPEQLEAIGIITGPGGYTGTRSGVAVAKTMAQFLELPLAGFNKIEAMLLGYPEKNILLAPMLDIRRGEVYTGLAGVNSEYEIKYLTEPEIYKLEEWLDFIRAKTENIILLASEFAAQQEKFSDLPANIHVDFTFQLKPEHITVAVHEYMKRGKASGYLDVQPFYVREAI